MPGYGGHYNYTYRTPRVVKTTTTTREFDEDGRVIKETVVVTETTDSYDYYYHPTWTNGYTITTNKL